MGPDLHNTPPAQIPLLNCKRPSLKVEIVCPFLLKKLAVFLYTRRYVHDPEKSFHEILVPTADTERCQWLLKLMLSIAKPVVLIGETGTSKTATIQQFLRTLDADATVRIRGRHLLEDLINHSNLASK